MHLSAEQAIFVVSSIRGLFKFLDLCFEVFEVLLFTLSECPLSSPVLGFPLLSDVLVDMLCRLCRADVL